MMLCLCSLAAQGQQNWQGTAAVARSGEFDTPGLFAASNAFAENMKILVQNAQTGESVQVTVIRRIEGAASVFLLLSEEAGKQIGLTGSQIVRVKASVVSTLGTDLSDSLQDQAYSSDPDLNPALSVTEQQLRADESGPEAPAEPEEPAVVEKQPAKVAQAAEESEPGAEPGAEAVQQLPEEPSAEIAKTPAATPESAELTPEEKRLQELTDRIPQKQLYMPPRQQEVYALAPEPPAEEAVQEETAVAEQPPDQVSEVEGQPPAEEIPEEAETEEQTEAAAGPQVAEAEEEPGETTEVVEEGPPEASMPGPEAEEEPLEVALPGPEAAQPEKPSPEGTRLPAPEEQPPLTMAPEEPPTAEIAESAVEEPVAEEPEGEAAEATAAEEEQPAAEVAAAEARAEEQAVLSETLPSRSYFVQLGAYSTRNLAEKLAGDLTQTYSVTILPASSGGRLFYKVLVGPLNVDESGTLLYQFRSRGFKDAFIQYVE
jgi:hypothetical protein